MSRIIKVLMLLAAVAAFGYVSNMDYEDTLLVNPNAERTHTVYIR